MKRLSLLCLSMLISLALVGCGDSDPSPSNSSMTGEDVEGAQGDTPGTEEDTAAPEEDTAAPEEDTAAPEEDTAAPEEDTAAPEEDTAAPEEDTAAPEEDTAAPEEDTAAPEEDTTAPEEDTVAPEEDTVAPEEDTVAPEEDTSGPDPCDGVDCGAYGECIEGMCECEEGFVLTDNACTDVNECAEANGGCDGAATCINVPGTFVCKCPWGMEGDGFYCGTDPTTLGYNGLHGYISSSSGATPLTYRYGASFYSAAWRLTPEPLKNFQIGLPGTWFTPDNSDNTTTAMCPAGTLAGDNWPEWGPTYSGVFQTMEGGLGYWANNQYRYGPPKFSMNATPDCYNTQIASPGWAFFNGPTPLPDNVLGIAQLSNRMIVPPDGLPFDGELQGELIGYGFIALPLTDPRPDPQPTGDQSWTLFLNSTNFKGPLAYYLPETWSRISKNYPFDEGRGLDSRPINQGLGGSMEINTVQQFSATGDDGVLYSKIPQLQFPVDAEGKTTLVRDMTFYSKEALFNDVLDWRNGGDAPSGAIAEEDTFTPQVSTYPVTYKQSEEYISGINELATPVVFENNVFGLQWAEENEAGMAKFPRYFKQVGNERVAISEEDVPPETMLQNKEFPLGTNPGFTYSAPLNGGWSAPGPAVGPFQADLGDCSTITYYWYKFVEQPVFQQYDWTPEEKDALQAIVEQIHLNWTPDKEYIPAPTGGTLGGFDPGLMVTAPEGYEVGYVPIVTLQEPSSAEGCGSNPGDNEAMDAALEALVVEDFVGSYERIPVQNEWHEVTLSVDENGQLWWENQANASWKLSLADGVLTTGDDCPYGPGFVGVELLTDGEGMVYTMPEGLLFNGDTFSRVWSTGP